MYRVEYMRSLSVTILQKTMFTSFSTYFRYCERTNSLTDFGLYFNESKSNLLRLGTYSLVALRFPIAPVVAPVFSSVREQNLKLFHAWSL